MVTITDLLVNAAAAHADRPAVQLDDLTITYGELLAGASAVATDLQRRGLSRGDRVGVVLPNVPAFPIIFFGVLLAGCVAVPMNPLLRENEVEHYLNDSGARLVFVWDGCDDVVAKVAETLGVVAVWTPATGPVGLPAGPISPVEHLDDETVVLLYTSGTTGQPKGAELTNRGLTSNAVLTAETLIRIDETDVIMGCLPLFHVFGLTCALNAAVSVGACLTLLPRFDPVAALAVIARDRVTVFEGVPTMYGAMLHSEGRENADVTSLRVCASGGAALPVEVLHSFEKAFGCVVLEGYGLSETSPVAAFNHLDAVRLPGSIGTPVRGVQMRLSGDDGAVLAVAAGEDVSTVGEIEIWGENVMKGYWKNPDATAESIVDGWFRTGDLGTVDRAGNYRIVDRKKALIIRGGYNVYPREIEEVLYAHPAVAEAAVVGIADDRLGEEVGAAVVLLPSASATIEELREFVKARVAAYKYPRHVWLVDVLPKGPTGKILRRDVRPPAGLGSR